MKKRLLRKKLQFVFWLMVVLGFLWAALMPHGTDLAPSNAVTIQVDRVAEIPVPPNPTQPVQSGDVVTVPVVPEQEPSSLHKVKIAIVIDDVGVDLKGSERAIMSLPPSVTLSFLPYAVRLREQTKQARELGHELLLHMPMEPLGHEDPGPGALLVDLPMRDLQQRFETALASFTGFDGVNNHMGSKFTAYAEGMDMVVAELQQRNLFFLDSRTSPQSLGEKIARQKGLPTLSRDVFLDDEETPEALRAQLEATERVAQRKGYAIAIGHPHAVTLDALQSWIPEAQKRGVEFVPLKNLLKKQ